MRVTFLTQDDVLQHHSGIIAPKVETEAGCQESAGCRNHKAVDSAVDACLCHPFVRVPW